MSVPLSMLSENLKRTLLASRDALRARLMRQGEYRVEGENWAFHEGEPDFENLPEEPLGVWLQFAGMREDPDAPFQSNYFIGRWQVFVVSRDRGTDPHGHDLTVPLSMIGDVVRLAGERFSDSSLDATVDFDDLIDVEHMILKDPRRDGRVSVTIIDLQYHHPLLLIEDS